jgi:hypothetical protein
MANKGEIPWQPSPEQLAKTLIPNGFVLESQAFNIYYKKGKFQGVPNCVLCVSYDVRNYMVNFNKIVKVSQVVADERGNVLGHELYMCISGEGFIHPFQME